MLRFAAPMPYPAGAFGDARARGGSLLEREAFAGILTLATTAVLGLLVILYRQHPEPFLGWSLVGWSARLASQLIAIGPEPAGLVWAIVDAFLVAAKSLAFLAAGVSFRWPHVMTRATTTAGLVVAVGVAALMAGVLPALATSETARLVEGTVRSVTLLGTGVAFWPRDLGKARGAALVAATFVIDAGLRLALPWTSLHETAVMVLFAAGLMQGLQSLGLVILVLDRARQRVEFLRDFNATLINDMGRGLALVGPDLRVQHANRWLTERFGDVAGRRCVDTYLAAPTQCPSCPFRESSLGPREFVVDGPDGRRLQLTCSPLVAPDGSSVLLELVTDITAQEQMRARLVHSERLATVGEMAARVAHEVRNPLAIMEVHAELVRRELEPGGNLAEARDYLGIIKGEIRRIARLVESYLRSGRLPAIAPARVELDSLLDATLGALEAELGLRRIRVHRTATGPGPALSGDAEQLGQVFMNLFRNAIEAMPDGGALTIATSRIDGRASVEVADTGPGVAPEDVETIFRPFHTTKPSGGGLGLALAREIVQAHGGSLTCRRQPGGGCFVVTLPLPDGHPEAPESRP